MTAATLRKQEGIGLIVALAAHAGLITWLALWKPDPKPVGLPQSVSVTLADEVGLVATSPDPSADPAPATAPMEGDTLPPPAAEPLPRLEPRPVPPPVARVVPTPPRPVPKPVTRRTPTIAELSGRRPSPAAKPPPKSPTRTATRTNTTGSRTTTGRTGGSVIGPGWLDGAPSGNGDSRTAPAPITGAVKSSLASEVARQLKRRWQGPNGLDVDKLVTTVEWDLNKDGSLAGPPRVLTQTGVTDANRPQAARHKEQALKAVRLAAPFKLPPEYYAGWKRLRFTFDWKINQ